MVFQDFQPIRVSEEKICIYLFRQNLVFTSLQLRSPVRVIPYRLSSVADLGCLSRIRLFSILDLGSEMFPSRIRIKEFKYFNPKKWLLSFRKYDPGCSTRIRILTFYPSRIQGSKGHRIPDPDPQHRTLVRRLSLFSFPNCDATRTRNTYLPANHPVFFLQLCAASGQVPAGEISRGGGSGQPPPTPAQDHHHRRLQAAQDRPQICQERPRTGRPADPQSGGGGRRHTTAGTADTRSGCNVVTTRTVGRPPTGKEGGR